MLSSRVVKGPTQGGGPVVGGGTIQWVLGNDGNAPWPKETTLRLIAGLVLTNPSVEVPPISPEQTVVVELEVANVEVETDISYVLVAPGGQPFGEIMTAKVVPESPSTTVVRRPLCALVASPSDGAPEGLAAAPGSVKRVEWTLANPGLDPWPQDATVRLVHSTLGPGRAPEEIAIPKVAAGMTLHVEVGALMPSDAGHFKALWAVMSPSFPDFGELLVAEFAVSSKVADCRPAPKSKRSRGASGDPRYSVWVSNKYGALEVEAEAEPQEMQLPQQPLVPTALEVKGGKATAGRERSHGERTGYQSCEKPGGKAAGPASPNAAADPTRKARAMLKPPAVRRASLWPLLSMLAGLFLGPRVCVGFGTERGVVGTCGDAECVAILEASETSVRVEGTVAHIEMVQTFRGSDGHGGLAMADASFVVPVHGAAVVTNFSADIGGKLLRGTVKERRHAQRIYDEHVQAGCPAALGQQGATRRQSPRDASDLFRISLGNLPASATAQVNLSLVQELAVEDGKSCSGDPTAAVRLMVPNAAPARYAPASAQGAAAAAELLQASGRRLPKSFAVNVAVHGDVQSVSSPSHGDLVSIRWHNAEEGGAYPSSGGFGGATRGPTASASMRLSGDNLTEVACRTDFTLRLAFGPSGASSGSPPAASPLAPRVALENHPVYSTWAAVVEFVPRFAFEPEASAELTFLVDRSGSMRGPKVRAASSALQHFVRSAPVGAPINVVGFGSHFEGLFREGARELREETFHTALTYAEGLEANFGGTEILAPLKSLLGEPPQSGRARRIFVLTDGEVWNQESVLDEVEERCGALAPDCQLFALGIGSGASTALVEGLARAGRGSARFVAEGEQDVLEEQVVQMLAAALQPTFSNVSVSWPSSPPAAQRHGGAVVPLLGRRRLQQKAEDLAKKSSPPSRNWTAEAAEPAPAPHEEAGGGLFDASAPSAAAAVRQRSVGAAVDAEEEAEALRHEQDIERFVAQGGVVEGPLQAPQPAPPILVGQRWAVYAFLGRLREQDLPSELMVRALRNGRPVELRAPVVSRTVGASLHALAARRLADSLEGRRGQPARVPLPGEDDRQWQVAALGVAYGLATARTSWLAVGEMPRDEEREHAASTLAEAQAGKLSGSLAVLDLSHLGSSLSLRSFSRLGSSLSVYGVARLGSSLSVLDFVSLGASVALRSFARLGSSVSVLDFLALGASLALRSFGRLGSSVSIAGLVRTTTTLQAKPLPAPAPPAHRRWPGAPVSFLAVGRPGSVLEGLPLLPVWRAGADGSACLAVRSNLSWWSRSASGGASQQEEAPEAQALQLWLLPAGGIVPHAAGIITPDDQSSGEGPEAAASAAATAASAGRVFALGVDCRLSDASGGSALARLRVGGPASEQSEKAEEEAMEKLISALGNPAEASASEPQWDLGCPQLPPSSYGRLLAAQRFDGSFSWPQAFLGELGWVNSSGMGISAQEALPPAIFKMLPAAETVLAAGTAISAWRRCFGSVHRKWALLERKTLATLQAGPFSSETVVALAERLVLSRALAVAGARPDAPASAR